MIFCNIIAHFNAISYCKILALLYPPNRIGEANSCSNTGNEPNLPG